jgi:hypothetical protein
VWGRPEGNGDGEGEGERKTTKEMNGRRAMVTRSRRKVKKRTNPRRKKRMRRPPTMATATQCSRCAVHSASLQTTLHD